MAPGPCPGLWPHLWKSLKPTLVTSRSRHEVAAPLKWRIRILKAICACILDSRAARRARCSCPGPNCGRWRASSKGWARRMKQDSRLATAPRVPYECDETARFSPSQWFQRGSAHSCVRLEPGCSPPRTGFARLISCQGCSSPSRGWPALIQFDVTKSGFRRRLRWRPPEFLQRR